MRTLWSCKDWKISRVIFPFPDLQKSSNYFFGRTAKSTKSLRHKGKGKRRGKVCNLVSELGIIFVRVGLELPRRHPGGSHSSGLVSTAGLWFRLTLNISENWRRYVIVYLVSHQWFETEAGSWVRDEKGVGMSEGSLTSLQPSETSALSRGHTRTNLCAHQPSKWKRFQAPWCLPLLMFWVIMPEWYRMSDCTVSVRRGCW